MIKTLKRTWFKGILFVIPMMLLCGCTAATTAIDAATPTVVPPISEKLGYEVPHIVIPYFGWKITTIGILDWTVSYNRTTFRIFEKEATEIITATGNVRDTTLALLGAGGLSLAPILYQIGLRKRKPGDISKADHEEGLKKVGRMPPEEFEATLKHSKKA